MVTAGPEFVRGQGVYVYIYICIYIPAAWWQELGNSLLVLVVGTSSTGSPSQQHHPTGCLRHLHRPLWPVETGKGNGEDLSPPVVSRILMCHTEFFPYFTVKRRHFGGQGDGEPVFPLREGIVAESCGYSQLSVLS